MSNAVEAAPNLTMQMKTWNEASAVVLPQQARAHLIPQKHLFYRTVRTDTFVDSPSKFSIQGHEGGKVHDLCQSDHPEGVRTSATTRLSRGPQCTHPGMNQTNTDSTSPVINVLISMICKKGGNSAPPAEFPASACIRLFRFARCDRPARRSDPKARTHLDNRID